jgi:hypothetical protein
MTIKEHDDIHRVFHWPRLPMARIKTFALYIALLSALSGCSAFFDFNAFSGVDKAAAPDPSRYQGPAGLANLQNDLNSPSIVDALKGSPSTVAAILANLNGAYNVTGANPTTPDAQTAAILYADLALKSTSGDILVNNIAATVVNNPSGNLQSMLASIVPPDVAGDITKFTAMVDNLLTAEGVYIHLGNALVPASPPPGMNMGDTAQKAAVSLLMVTILSAVENTPAPGTYTQPQAIGQLFALMNIQTNTISNISITDPFSPMPPWLKNIFDAAGAPYPG